MEKLVVFACLKCNKELVAHEEEMNKRISEGVKCSYCNFVMTPVNFVRASCKDKLIYPPRLKDLEEEKAELPKFKRMIRFGNEKQCKYPGCVNYRADATHYCTDACAGDHYDWTILHHMKEVKNERKKRKK